MSTLTVLALRVVIGIALAGSLLVQAVLVPLVWADLEDAPSGVKVPLVVIVVCGIVTMQVTGICLWRLLTLVRRGTVFSVASFRYVDTIVGAVVTASLLAFALAVVLAPGEAVAPGLVGLICGVSLVIGGVALLVLVLRTLLAQAVALDVETRQLQAELNDVI